MLLMIDNYDSFTFNLVQYFAELGAQIKTVRNDALSIADMEAMAPEALIVSPGPCTPTEAGISVEAIQHFAGKLPILGVCLGHQSMGQAFGGKVVRAERLMHGKTSPISHDDKGVFADMPQPFEATRYHSLVVEKSSLPACFEISAQSDTGEIMGLRHKEYANLEGVQFHPESILTEQGKLLCGNFLKLAGVDTSQGAILD